MEGVPRLPFLSFEMKRGQADSEFSLPLQKLILEHFHENPGNFATEVKEFAGLRHSAINCSKDQSGCAALKKYFCQLQLLLNRLPKDERKMPVFQFNWTDIYAGISFSVSDFRYEMASILYNIGSLHSQLGQTEPREGADGMKIVCTHYQCAAWAYQQINKNYIQPRGTDMAPDLMELFEVVCLAQAQECILEKSMVDNRKSANTAKIAAQIADYYKNALQMLERAMKPQEEESLGEYVGQRLLRHWRKVFEFKNHYYGAITLLFQGMHCEELQKMGHRITYYQAAVEKLNEAGKVYKGIPEQEVFADAISFCSDVFGGKLKGSQKENEFVYHEIVPPLGSLPEVKGAVLAKGTGFDCSDPDVAGPDLFGRLISMEAHASSSMYSEEKAKLLRAVSEKIESKDDALYQFMAVIQAEELVLSLENQRLPEELVERCASFSVQNDPVGSLTRLMSQLSDLSVQVEEAVTEINEVIQNDENKEAAYQKALGKRPPSMLFTEIKRELDKFKKAHAKASEANSALHKLASAQLPNLNILAKPLNEIQHQLPSLSSMRNTIHESSIMEMERLVKKVDEMKRQRVGFAHQLREALQSDDLTKKLASLPDSCELEAVFAEEIKKHDHQIQLIDQNLAAQERILQALTEANTRFAETRRAMNQLISTRNSSISALIHAYDAYEDIIQKIDSGIKFYKKLLESLQKLRQKANSVYSVQEEERAQALKKLEVKKMYTDESTVVGPTLKDYLMARKAGGTAQNPGYRPAPLGAENPEAVRPCNPQSYAYPSAPMATPPVRYGTANPYAQPEYITSSVAGMNLNDPVQPQNLRFPSETTPSYARAPQKPYNAPEEDRRPASAAEQQHSHVSGSQAYNLGTYPVPSYGTTVYQRPQGSEGFHTSHSSAGSFYSSYTPTSGTPGYGQSSHDAKAWPPGPQRYNPGARDGVGGASVNSTSSLRGTISALEPGAPPQYPTSSAYPQPSPYQSNPYPNPSPSPQQGQSSTQVPAYQHAYTSPSYQGPHQPASEPSSIAVSQTVDYYAASRQYIPPQYGNYSGGGTQALPPVSQDPTPHSQTYTYPPSNTPRGSVAPVDSAYYNHYISHAGGRAATSVVQSVPYPATNGAGVKPTENSTGYSSPQTNIGYPYSPHQSGYYPAGQQSTATGNSVSGQSQQPQTGSVTKPAPQLPLGYIPGVYNSFQPGTAEPNQAYQSQSSTSGTVASGNQVNVGGSMRGPVNAVNHYDVARLADAALPNNQAAPSHVNQSNQSAVPYNQEYPGQSIPRQQFTPTPNFNNPSGNQAGPNHANQSAMSANHMAVGYPQGQTNVSYGNQGGVNRANQPQEMYPYHPQGSNIPPTHVAKAVPHGSVTNVLDSGVAPPASGILQPTPAGSATSSPAHKASKKNVVSNVDLLAELDVGLKADVVMTTRPDNMTTVRATLPSSNNIGATFDLQSLIQTKIAVPAEPKKADVFEDRETLNRFAMEVNNLESLVAELPQRRMKGPTPLELKWKEIQDAQDRESSKSKISVARCYPMKNRQPDILPYDHNRITLPSTKDDYINASNLGVLLQGAPTIIATQAPLACTLFDFWDMVWEQQTEALICLLTDSELANCSYFPRERAAPFQTGCFSVLLQTVQNKHLWVERVLQLTNKDMKTSRYVVHLQFSGWGPTDFPSSSSSFLSFVNECARCWRQQRNLSRPLIVHCSAGAGKTGVFVSILASILETELTGSLPDIFKHCLNASLRRRGIMRDRDHVQFAYNMLLTFGQDVLQKHNLTVKSTIEHPVDQVALPGPDLTPSQENEREEPASLVQTSDVPEGAGYPHPVQSWSTSSSASDSPKHGPLEASLDPAQFTLGTGTGSKKSRKQEMKERFLSGQSSVSVSETDPSDPFRDLDPFWSLKKTDL